MKKLLVILCAFALISSSCSSDDDNKPSQDPFIGTWKFLKYVDNGVEEFAKDCDAEETLEISVDGRFRLKQFDEDANGNCVFDYEESFTWENRGDGNYAITNDDGTFVEQFVFEANFLILTYTYIENGEAFIEEEVYVRV